MSGNAGAGGNGCSGCGSASTVHESLLKGGFEALAVGTAKYLSILPGAEPAELGRLVTTNNIDIASNGVLNTTSQA